MVKIIVILDVGLIKCSFYEFDWLNFMCGIYDCVIECMDVVNFEI